MAANNRGHKAAQPTGSKRAAAAQARPVDELSSMRGMACQSLSCLAPGVNGRHWLARLLAEEAKSSGF